VCGLAEPRRHHGAGRYCTAVPSPRQTLERLTDPHRCDLARTAPELEVLK